MKIVFAGTTEFGIPALEKIKDQIVLVITQPDKPVGRKKILTPPPIKIWALQNNIPVEQPEKIYNLKSIISNLNPDLLLVAAYGQIVPKIILDIPKFGSINIHGSILPKYRGASPIQAALLNGDRVTGITLLKMDEKMDHGPLLAQQTLTVDDNDNFLTLYKKLAELSADLVSKTLPDWFAGKIEPQEQNHDQATFTKLFTLQDGRIDWTRQASEVVNKIRALNPEPGTWTTLDNKSVKILEAETIAESIIDLPGKIYESGKEMLVKCQTNSVKVKLLQPEGKKPMTGRDYLNGLKSKQNLIFI